MQRKIVGALIVGTLIALLIYSVKQAIIKNSPQYVLECESIPYQEEAIEFFNDNREHLLLLSNSKSSFANLSSAYDYYVFQHSNLEELDIPDHLKETLFEMECSASKQYCVVLKPDRIEVEIHSGTHLIVILTDGDDMCYGMKDEWDIATDLGDGWSLHVAYIVRG